PNNGVWENKNDTTVAILGLSTGFLEEWTGGQGRHDVGLRANRDQGTD
ncbi:hypothetical protein A2U01_0070220, partial [Trifolium medium]|nr:hypothetical protein [Trifolium medium]